MKVITQERLRGLINKIIDRENTAKDEKDKFIFGVMRVQCAEIIEACQELDTLTVTRLRPMIDLPQCQYVNAYRYQEGFECVYLNIYQRLLGFGGVDVDKTDFEGFIPMPRYEPEKA